MSLLSTPLPNGRSMPTLKYIRTGYTVCVLVLIGNLSKHLAENASNLSRGKIRQCSCTSRTRRVLSEEHNTACNSGAHSHLSGFLHGVSKVICRLKVIVTFDCYSLKKWRIIGLGVVGSMYTSLQFIIALAFFQRKMQNPDVFFSK